MSDQTLMPFGKFKGEKLANVPEHYLIWLHNEGKCYGELKTYIEENLDVMKSQIDYENKKRN